MEKKCKTCADKNCENLFTQYKSTDKYCSGRCKMKNKKVDLTLKAPKGFKTIPKVSKKRQIENLQYQVLRKEFLDKKENQICPITKSPTNDIHHKKGRVGSLFLNTNYWIALSREGHRFVEENPDWAKENGYSLNRLSND